MGEKRGTLRVAVGDGHFRSEHERLVATALRRGDADPEGALRGARLEGSYHERTLELARRAFLERMRREHHSSTVFSGLLPQLIEAEATLDTKTAVLRMAMDELRHAALCGGVVELLGGEAILETDLATPSLPDHPTCTPIERALRNVVFVGCMNETIAVGMLTEERALVREPAIEAVLTQLVADEVSHAKLGWTYLDEVWPQLDEEQRARTSAYLPYAFRHLEESLMGPMAHMRFDDLLRDELAALGVPSPQDMRELFYAAMETAVLPPLQARGLPATESWRRRRSV